MIFLLGLLVLALILSPIFKLKKVSVYGNENIDSEEIKNIVSSANILLLSSSELESNLLKKFPKISEIEVEKNIFKRSLSIIISERIDAGIACKENTGNCFYFDQNGIIFENAPRTSGYLVLSVNDFSEKIFSAGEKIYSQETVDSIISIKEYLDSSGKVKIDHFEITANPPKEIKAVSVKGWYILFDATRDIKKQLSMLKTALDEKIKDTANLEYIDLTIENRIYYK